MKKVAVILAEGFEELEAVNIIDVLRRGGIDLTMVGLDSLNIKGAHNIEIKADVKFDETKFENFDMIILPGGITDLANSKKLAKILQEFKNSGKILGAICAAPLALYEAGVLDGNYTCYPGFEEKISKNGYIANQNVVNDKNIITSKGPATAMEFALYIVKFLEGENKYTEVKNGLLFP